MIRLTQGALTKFTPGTSLVVSQSTDFLEIRNARRRSNYWVEVDH